MTKVLQVLGRSAGGIARHVAQVTDALDGEPGFTVDIAGPTDLPVALPKLPLPLAIPDGPFGHRAAVRELRRIVAEGGYEVVHAHGLRASIDAGRASGPLQIPTVATIHNLVRADIVGRFKAPLYRLSERLSLRSSTRTFAVSEDIASHLRALDPSRAARIETLYLGIGDAPAVTRGRRAVRSELGIPDDHSLIVTAARLSAQKALHVMIQAVARLPGATLAVMGEGPLEGELKDVVTVEHLEDRVLFLGFRADVHDVIAAADAFCLSSVWEGVPLAAQEAILLGVPVVTTAVGGMEELIADRVSGRAVPKNDPIALASALNEVLRDEVTAKGYADAALESVRRRFSTTKMLDRLKRAYVDAARGEGTS